jgi:excisionase family DNA binding protein
VDEQYLTVKDVAERLKVSRVTVYSFIKAGKLESVKLGKSRRISLSALQRFEASGTSQSDKEAAAGHDPAE